MKKQLTTLLTLLSALYCFSQPSDETIKVSDDIELIRLSENAYIHVSQTVLPGYGLTSANGLIFVNGDEALLFDSPWNDSLTEQLYSFITDSMKLKVTGFVPNHWHEDCMGGLAFLKDKGVSSYAGQLTIDIAKSKGLPVPEHGFSDSLQLQCGEKYVKCYYLGAAHSSDNIVVWIPSEQILFAGCIVKSTGSKDLGNTADGDLKAYPETIEKLIRKFADAKIVIPGHGAYGGFELITHTLGLASD